MSGFASRAMGNPGEVERNGFYLKKHTRQDLQDHLDRKAFGLRVSRRKRKKPH